MDARVAVIDGETWYEVTVNVWTCDACCELIEAVEPPTTAQANAAWARHRERISEAEEFLNQYR